MGGSGVALWGKGGFFSVSLVGLVPGWVGNGRLGTVGN